MWGRRSSAAKAAFLYRRQLLICSMYRPSKYCTDNYGMYKGDAGSEHEIGYFSRKNDPAGTALYNRRNERQIDSRGTPWRNIRVAERGHSTRSRWPAGTSVGGQLVPSDLYDRYDLPKSSASNRNVQACPDSWDDLIGDIPKGQDGFRA